MSFRSTKSDGTSKCCSKCYAQEDGKVRFFAADLNGGHLPASGQFGFLRSNERRPNKREARQIAAKLPQELSLLFRAANSLGIRCIRLSQMSVQDLDPDKGSILVDMEPLPLNAEAREIVFEAIGNRTEGPIFAAPGGARWDHHRIRRRFAPVKRALGLDSGVRI